MSDIQRIAKAARETAVDYGCLGTHDGDIIARAFIRFANLLDTETKEQAAEERRAEYDSWWYALTPEQKRAELKQMDRHTDEAHP